MAVVSSITRMGTIEPFDLQVGRNQIAMHRNLFKFGINAAVSTSATTIWPAGTEYVFPAAATVMKVSSTSASDTGNGTGAQTILVEGLDANYAEISEVVTLNGTTAVNTTNSYLRINNIELASAGSGATAAGTIYIGTGTVTGGVPATEYGRIVLGYNASTQAIYTVPAGYTAYVTSYTFTSGSATANNICSGFFQHSENGFSEIQASARMNGGNAFDRHFDVPFAVPEMKDIALRASSTAASNMTGEMHILLIKNDSQP